jgi:hypothetical protein
MWTHLVERSAIGVPANAAVEGNGGALGGDDAARHPADDAGARDDASAGSTKETT